MSAQTTGHPARSASTIGKPNPSMLDGARSTLQFAFADAAEEDDVPVQFRRSDLRVDARGFGAGDADDEQLRVRAEDAPTKKMLKNLHGKRNILVDPVLCHAEKEGAIRGDLRGANGRGRNGLNRIGNGDCFAMERGREAAAQTPAGAFGDACDAVNVAKALRHQLAIDGALDE